MKLIGRTNEEEGYIVEMSPAEYNLLIKLATVARGEALAIGFYGDIHEGLDAKMAPAFIAISQFVGAKNGINRLRAIADGFDKEFAMSESE